MTIASARSTAVRHWMRSGKPANHLIRRARRGTLKGCPAVAVPDVLDDDGGPDADPDDQQREATSAGRRRRRRHHEARDGADRRHRVADDHPGTTSLITRLSTMMATTWP